MADDRPTYRPRRAAGGDEPTPEPTGGAGRFTEDEARPIFREAAADADAATVRTPGPGADAPALGAPAAAGAAGDDTGTGRTRRLNFTPRQRPVDDESTTLLPRTSGLGADPSGSSAPAPLGRGDDESDDLDERPSRLGRRTRLALLVSAVAAVVVVGLAVFYAVVDVSTAPSGTGEPSGSVSSAGGSPSATALLDDASMLTVDGARAVDAKRTWTAGDLVRGALPAGSGASCLGSDPLEGAPTAQQTLSRTLTASGSDAPTVLHVAQAYASVEDATQAFAVSSRALGTCTVPGDWIFSGRAVEGVGDEATAVATRSTSGGGSSQHWVVVSRTGRALDVVDAATPGKKALNVNDVTKALASVVGVQCGTAGGACATTPATKDGPPPAGGDEPGLLATGDLPPVGSTTAPWVGTPVEQPSEDFTGSQCETVTWATTAAVDKTSRVYLLQDVPGIFGLNEVVLTAKDADTASKLVDKIRDDWSSCKERKLTATVDKATKVTGVAADGGEVVGYTTEVEQKAGSTTTRFRVGIASSGTKVAFVFLNPQKGLDVDGDDWNVVAVRAVQRATQQS